MMNITEANEISIVDFLEKGGFKPHKVSGDNYWYLSPLRNERTPSFKVNRRLNKWYDYGMAVGGDLVELAKRLGGFSSVSETLRSLEKESSYSFEHKTSCISGQKNKISEPKMQDIELFPLQKVALLHYFQKRNVDVNIATKYCLEIHYVIRHKHYFAVAFGNMSNGYEIRNPYFKGCIGHKDISLIPYTSDERQDGCLVFEGFMDFLSFLTFVRRQDYRFLIEEKCDYIVMNSVCNLRKTLLCLEHYRHIHCFLDNDIAGRKTLETIRSLYEFRVTDEFFRYSDYKDVNDCLVGRTKNSF